MSLRPAFMRNQRKSETDLRRHNAPNVAPSPSITTTPTDPSSQRSSNSSTRNTMSTELAPPVPALREVLRISTESDGTASTPAATAAQRRNRFSLLRFRNASDSQLSKRAREQGRFSEDLMPPVPSFSQTPSIIATSPTMDVSEVEPPDAGSTSGSRPNTARANWRGLRKSSTERSASMASQVGREGLRTRSIDDARKSSHNELARPVTMAGLPTGYDEGNHSLQPPTPRLSESSRSTASSTEPVTYTTTTTTHTVSTTTTTTFFRLPRRKKNKAPLFPLPPKVPASESILQKNDSRSGSNVDLRPPTQSFESSERSASPLASPTKSPMSPTAGGPLASLLRNGSSASVRSGRSVHSLTTRGPFQHRRRSSTMGSFHDITDGSSPQPSSTPPTRSSLSGVNRPSLGGLFSFTHRSRLSTDILGKGSQPETPLVMTPQSDTSKANSFNLTRESIVIPEREEDDTPAKYLDKLQEAISRSIIAGVVSKGSDAFSQAVLRRHMRSISYFGDPIDMALRKLLMQVELPKETQQIDRVLQAFADRYYECNPGIFSTTDQAYFITFSLLILHTDVFNKNNKHKMQRPDYLKNTAGEDVAAEILECFYDNIAYTPFIRVEDEYDINGEKIVAHQQKKSLFTRTTTETARKFTKELVDPYSLILEGDLDALRPILRDVMNLENPYNYLGTSKGIDIPMVHRAFFKSGVLQIVSARSRPDAFMSPSTISNPIDASPGVVDIKVSKVGVLWRKDPKKKKTRSPWQEWGAILTGSQLYFFKNSGWVKNLMHQQDLHRRTGDKEKPVVFKPPLEVFKADALMSTEDAVALVDSSYRRHKNAFTFVRHGGLEEVFLADTEDELNDWLAKLNYAAAFRTSGVRMRAFVGSFEGRRDSASRPAVKNAMPSDGEILVSGGGGFGGDNDLAKQIMATRRQIMMQKIEEAGEKLKGSQKELEVLLRNARHLQILTPIQPKTRDHVIISAGKFSAKLKWTRIEILRLQCHRDILALDLEDERPTPGGRSRHLSVVSTAPSVQITPAQDQTPGIGDEKRRFSQGSALSIPASAHTQGTARPHSRGSSTDHFSDFEVATESTELAILLPASDPDVLRDPPARPTEWRLSNHRMVSSTSAKSFRSAPPLGEQALGLLDTEQNEGFSRLVTGTPNMTSEESAILKRAGVLDSLGGDSDDKSTDVTGKPLSGSDRTRSASSNSLGSGLPKPKARRSLHRTLREAHLPTNHRNKRLNESGSSASLREDFSTTSTKQSAAGEKEAEKDGGGLTRGVGSFTVHGKKASVVTFGSEWDGMTAEEKLRTHRSSQQQQQQSVAAQLLQSPQQARLLSESINIDDESNPSEVDSIRSSNHGYGSGSVSTKRTRRESAASVSTATIRSSRREQSKDRASERGADLKPDNLGSPSIGGDRPRTPLQPIHDNEAPKDIVSSVGSGKSSTLITKAEQILATASPPIKSESS
jgi:hypothetical protein